MGMASSTGAGPAGLFQARVQRILYQRAACWIDCDAGGACRGALASILSYPYPSAIMGRSQGTWPIPPSGLSGGNVKTYVFQVELEPDEEGWRAFYPPWEEIGASTWGCTQEEARKNIEEVLTMILEEFEEEGKSVPDAKQLTISEGTLVAVSR